MSLFSDIIVPLLISLTYSSLSYARAQVVKALAPEELGKIALIIIGLLWPVSIVLWAMSCLASGPSPHPLSSRRVAPAETPEKPEITAARDWEARASYWYAEGERAEAEDDQALKWLAAANLGFLLDSRPPGAETPGEKAKRVADMQAVERATANEEFKAQTKGPIESWPSYSERQARLRRIQGTKRSVPSLYSAPTAAHIGGNAVGFCNLCYRYRKPEDLAMKGVCRECSTEQGLG